METKLAIRRYVVESFLLGSDDDFDDDASLIESGIFDSTAVVEIVSYLEETFKISIDDEDLVPENLDSISRLAGFVERKQAGAMAASDTATG